MSAPAPSARARKLYRHPAVVVGTVLALGATAFVGYGAWTRRGDVAPSRGGQAFLADPQVATQAPPAPAAVSAAAAKPASRPTAVPTLAPSSGAASSAIPVAGPSARPTPFARAGTPAPRQTGASIERAPSVATSRPDAKPHKAAAARAFPVAGSYGLEVAGSENVKFGPFSFCGREFPVETKLVVAPAEGEPAGSYNFDVRLFPDAAGQHDERHIYRYGRAGVTQNFESATVTCSGVRQSSEVSYVPVQARVKFPLKVGTTWAGKGGDAERTESYTTEVTGTEALTLGGREVEAYVVETTSEFTGSEKGTRVQRWWYAPAFAMPLRWSDHTEGSRAGATYTNDLTVSVTSVPEAPA